MPGKRKKNTPRRLDEAKRSCINWNSNNSSASPCLCLGDNNDDIEEKRECVANGPKVCRNPESGTAGKKCPYASIQIDYGSNPDEKSVLHDNVFLIGELVFRIDGSNDNVSQLFQKPINNNDDNNENVSSLYLTIFQQDVNGGLLGEISVCSKYQGSSKRILQNLLSGSLLYCNEIITSLEYLSEKGKISLKFNNQSSENASLKILVKLSPPQGDVTDLNLLPTKKIADRHMKYVMQYFYPNSRIDITSDNHKKCFHYTGEMIQELYNHIMKYHQENSDFITAIDDEDFGLSSNNMLSAAPQDAAHGSFESIRRNMDELQEDSLFDIDESSCSSKQSEMTEFVNESSNNHDHVKDLLPSLRQYQQDAVDWMIKKENTEEYEYKDRDEHVLWTKLSTIDNKTFYYNPYTARLASKMVKMHLPHGGILADEMGLGKTVEVLALILDNAKQSKFILPQCSSDDLVHHAGFSVEDKLNDCSSWCCICNVRVNFEKRIVECNQCKSLIHFECAGSNERFLGEYICVGCVSKQIIETHCTLIVSPETIVNQWMEEIDRHVKQGALKYLMYRGVGKDGFIQPSILAEYDIIITTYATLRADFYHVQAEEAKLRSMRSQKKYVTIPSPLISLKFWRICLDEAQMIQCTTTRTAEMAIRIQAEHRWCVTGTPVQKGLEDIYGMVLFIGVFPYCIKAWWTKLLYEPLIHGDNQPLFRLLSRIMWRTEKKNVLDQINLPEQVEQVTKLAFSPVERHFYEKLQEICAANTMKEIHKWSETETALSDIDKSSLHKLLAPLLRLRLACCHPHVVRGGVLSLQKTHLTMEKLLERLITKSKLECMDAHRQLMCSINGLAAIDIIEEKLSDAIDRYRDAMQSWLSHEDMFKTDILQKIHTMKNLAEVLSKVDKCSHALSDDKLNEEVEDLKKEYLKKADAKVLSTEQMLETMQSNLRKSKEDVDWKNPWWIRVLDYYHNRNECEIISRIQNELDLHGNCTNSIRNKFSTISGLQYIISNRLDSLMELRGTLLQRLGALRCQPTKEIIITTAECCLRPTQGSGAPKCNFCNVDDLFTEYESRMFFHRGMADVQIENDESRKFGGLRAETELDVVLKTIQATSRQHYFDSEIKDHGKAHLEFMDILKQEFKCLRQLWFALHQRISAFDELEMSVLKLRIRYPGEETKEKYVIDVHEVKSQQLKLQSDRIIAENELRKKKGQLFYLKNLEKTQNTENGSNPETCPICTKVLGFQWAVFCCGHCYCCDCVYMLERQHSFSNLSTRKAINIKCPLCRTRTFAEDISFVILNADDSKEKSDIAVKGSYSVKIEAVVRRILKINHEDPDGKIIVFSTWQNVLDLISKALTDNDIIFRYGSKSKRHFQACLADFKKIPSVKVILLPLKSGAKGLNIIEATHVVLVEPTLHPANEHQAIGRVHRIGQTKPTFVHRFLVRRTVEERICHLLQTKSSSSTARDETSTSLTLADVSHLISEGSSC
eukprot:gene3768-4290_t